MKPQAFCVWLLSLSVKHLEFIHLFHVSVIYSFLLLSIILLHGCTTVYLSMVIGFWFAKSPIPNSQVMWFGEVWPNPTSKGIHSKTWSTSIFYHPDQREVFRGGHMAQFNGLIFNARQLRKLSVTRRYWTDTMKRDVELVSLVTILPLGLIPSLRIRPMGAKYSQVDETNSFTEFEHRDPVLPKDLVSCTRQ